MCDVIDEVSHKPMSL